LLGIAPLSTTYKSLSRHSKLIKLSVHIYRHIGDIFREPANIEVGVTSLNLSFQLSIGGHFTIRPLKECGLMAGFTGNIGTMLTLIIPLYLYFIVELFSGFRISSITRSRH